MTSHLTLWERENLKASRMLWQTGSIGLLESLKKRASLTEENSVDMQEFVRTVIYGGKLK